MANLHNFLATAVRSLITLVASLPEMLIAIIVTLVATFFFCRDKELILRSSYLLVPAKYRSVDVPVQDPAFDYQKIARVADQVLVMLYDEHYRRPS